MQAVAKKEVAGLVKNVSPAAIGKTRPMKRTGLLKHLRKHGWLTAPEIAARMGVHPSTAKRFAREGVLRAVRADDKGVVLFEPPNGPLPQAQPGKRFRDRRRFPKLVSKMSNGVQYEA